MCTIEKEIEKYISEIESNLVCCGRLKKSLAKEIEGSVYDYAESRDIKDISEVYNHFGTPEEMARAYLSQVDPKKIVKAVKIKKTVVIGVITAIFIFSIYLVLAFVDGHKSNIGYYEKYSAATNTSVTEQYIIESEIIIEN